MKITQISVFLENKSGRLYDAVSLLGKKKINIRALTIAESEDYGILRLVVDKPALAAESLKKDGFVANITDIVAVEIADTPGGLAKVLGALSKDKIDVEYMYAFVEKQSGKALMVFRFENIDKAVRSLAKNKFVIVGKKEIQSL
ncbi:MAG TPA: hypothetical protein PKG81_03020 [Candidatus Omnitrophota bacterium]|nr:hypothetical protein [Candidatus Omnitrophota bacterium]